MSEPVRNSYKLDDMTTGEAAAFRAGWEAAREAAANIAEEGSNAERDYERGGWEDTPALVIADRIRTTEPPR